MKTRTRAVLFTVVGAAALVALLIMGAGVLFFLTHHDSSSVSADGAKAEFVQIRARFAGETPLLDMHERRVVQRPLRSGTAQVLSLHTAVFDTRGGPRMVHVTVPYWFGRAFARHGGVFEWLGELTYLDDTEFDPEAIHLSLDQIERHGPGLLVDYQHPSGGQFLAWAE